MTPVPSIEVGDLELRYGDVVALQGVSFRLDGPKVYGLLGRNGAGKSSLLAVLAALRKQTRGRVLVGGEPVFENPTRTRQICLIRETGDTVESSDRVSDALAFARTWRADWDEDDAGRLVERFEVPVRHRIGRLSRGQRCALGIILGLASRAPITMFDESYLGAPGSSPSSACSGSPCSPSTSPSRSASPSGARSTTACGNRPARSSGSSPWASRPGSSTPTCRSTSPTASLGADWPQDLGDEHVFGAATDLPAIFVAYVLAFLVWAAVGAIVGAAVHRHDDGWGLVVLPVCVLLLVASGFAVSSANPPFLNRLFDGYADSLVLAVILCLPSAAAGLGIAWALIREIPIRSKAA